MLFQNVNYPFGQNFGLSPSAREPAPIVCKGFFNCLLVFFSFLFKFLIVFSGALAVIMFIWAGILFIVGGHDEKKRTEAKNRLIWGIIGLVVALISYALVVFIQNTVSGKIGLVNKAYAGTVTCPPSPPSNSYKINIDINSTEHNQLRTIIETALPELSSYHLQDTTQQQINDYMFDYCQNMPNYCNLSLSDIATNLQSQDPQIWCDVSKLTAQIWIDQKYPDQGIKVITVDITSPGYITKIYLDKAPSTQPSGGGGQTEGGAQPGGGGTQPSGGGGGTQPSGGELPLFKPQPIGCSNLTVLDLIEGNKEVPKGLLTKCILWFVYKIFGYLYIISMLSAVAILIYGGFKYITSSGKAENIHKILIFAIVGVIVTILSYSIVKALEYTLTK